MTTHDKDKVIAAAKEAGTYIDDDIDGNPTIEVIPESCWEKFYAIAFEAGAASRDAEVVSLTNQRDYEYVRAENAEHDRLLVKIAPEDAEIAELVAALESVEWTQLGKMPEGKHCCYCGALEKHGHVTGCKVAISLKRTTLAQALSKVRKP